jgi:glycosyltransferase involved in cell wall biosynthesis
MAGSVNILLSTYNGKQFLDELIQSLFLQTYPNIKISVRDDGSSDGTLESLKEYENKYSNFIVTQGARQGAACSFMKLLCEADPACNFYAFCDQDDVWLPDKIKDAVVAMEACKINKPLLYFSRLEYVDSALGHLGYSKIHQKYGLRNAIVENIVSGCTIVINRSARNLICEQVPRFVLMHDWWFYLVVSAFGHLIYDIKPNIKYRQHSGNAIGEPTNTREVALRLLVRYLNFNKSGLRASDQAEEFYKCYARKLAAPELKILEDYLNAKNNILSRFNYARKMEVWKQSRWGNVFLPIRIIAGRF